MADHINLPPHRREVVVEGVSERVWFADQMESYASARVAAAVAAEREACARVCDGIAHAARPEDYDAQECGEAIRLRAASPPADAQAEARDADTRRLVNALTRRCYTMSEPHLSGSRVVIGFERIEDAGEAHVAIAAVKRAAMQAERPEPQS